MNKVDKTIFKTRTFEGPLDLLLYQIQTSEINIYDIPISEITGQFLEYIKIMEDIGIADLSSFYKMAAELLYIKSRMILPVEVEFDEEYEDPRQDLVESLLEYEKYKKLSALLSDNENISSLNIDRKERAFNLPFLDKDLFKDVDANTLLSTFTSLIEKSNINKLFNVYEEVSEEEKISLIYELLEEYEQIEIEEVIVNLNDLNHIISTFFAILTLTSKKEIIFFQDNQFDKIYLKIRDVEFASRIVENIELEVDKTRAVDISEEILLIKEENRENSLDEKENCDIIIYEEEIDLLAEDYE